MKITKYLLLLLLLFSIAFSVFVATQPSDFKVKRYKKVLVSKENVFEYINDFSNWKNWHPQLQGDSLKIVTISKDRTQINWLDTGSKTSYNTLKTFKKDSIYQEFYSNGVRRDVNWSIKKQKDSTLIVIEITGQLTFKEKMLSVLNGGVEQVFNNELETILKNLTSSVTKDVYKYSISIDGFTTKSPTFYIQIVDSTSLNKFDTLRSKNFKILNQFLKKHNIKRTGTPFTIFSLWNEKENSTVFSTCIPVSMVSDSIVGNGKIKTGKIDEFYALKSTLKGSLTHRKEIWDTSFDYILKNEHTQNETGTYIEVYKEESKVKPYKNVTEIYIPVRKLVAEVDASQSTDSLTVQSEQLNVTLDSVK